MNILVIPNYFGISVAGVFHSLAFDIVALLCVLAHFNCMTSNPGAVPSNARPLPDLLERTETIPICKHSGCFKPPRSHYDSVTRRCIVRMDHYCPWVNNTVGLKNHKFFILFCFYIHILCVYGLALIALRYNECITIQKAFICSDNGVGGEIMILGTGGIAILFGLFTFLMLCVQIYTVLTNRTLIDRLKNTQVNSTTSYSSNLWEVFGDARFGRGNNRDEPKKISQYRHRFMILLDWFNPFSRPRWGDERSRVFGYWVPTRSTNEVEMGSSNTVSSNCEEAKLLG